MMSLVRSARSLVMSARGVEHLVLLSLLVAACGVTVAPPSPDGSGAEPTLATGSPPPGPTLPPPTLAAPPSTDGPVLTPGATATPIPSTGPPPSPSPSPTPFPPPAVFPSTIGPELRSAVQARLDRLRTVMTVPGVSVAVRLPSTETTTWVSGVASIEPAEGLTPGTAFAIASVTKTFVAALILRLDEEGTLSLDDRLSAYLPGYPAARRISVLQLLSHTSGLHDYFSNPRYLAEAFTDLTRLWTFDEILGLVQSPVCAPGACYHYSNTNYVLLGRIAEVATGSQIQVLLRDRFLLPLGLDRTVFQPEQPTPADAAHGYVLAGRNGRRLVDLTGDSEVIPNVAPASIGWAAGGMASTPSDLATWAAALYGGDALEPDSLARMVDFSGPPDGYGLGTRSFIYRDRSAVGHTGAIHGFTSLMAYLPGDGVSIAVSANRGGASPHRIAKRVLWALLGG